MNETVEKQVRDSNFSGTLLVKREEDVLAEANYGYRNRVEKLENNLLTRYGIASGCKIFTAVAICQLVDKGKLAFDATLTECLSYEFPHFSKEVTIHQLLTHTSGVPDYFDEEVMDDFEELWVKTPMYFLRNLKDFLPLFQNDLMKFEPGERFAYNNGGYILLGLVVEAISDQPFAEYVEEHIFQQAGMTRSGYFELDALPSNTAQGYVDDVDGSWKTNVYAVPVKGGADGGAYVTAGDMTRFWQALIQYRLLSKKMTLSLLNPHTQTDEEGEHYGYGVWIEKTVSTIRKYHIMGYDPGVSFHSAFYPETSSVMTVCSNQSDGAYDAVEVLEKEMNL